MKLVELTRDMRPWRAGDSALVPDALADALVKTGEAQNARPFPSVVEKPEPPSRGTYLTRKRS